MKSRGLLFSVIAAFTLTFCPPTLSFAAPALTISSSGNGTFILQGSAVDGVAGMDITVRYDITTLANPQVSQGGLITGAMVVVNANVPGTVRMNIIRATAFSGSGAIATITFNRTGSSPGHILSLSAVFINIDGKPIPVVAQVINPTTTAASDSSSDKKGALSTNANASTSSGSTSQQTSSVGMVAATPGSTASENQENVSSSSAEGEQPMQAFEPSERAADTIARAAESTPMKTPEKKYLSHQSVLDRFGAYEGARTVKALTSLFEQDAKAPYRQEPAVALADGVSTVKVYFSLDVADGGAPEFAMISGTLLSLKRDGVKSGAWVAEIRPAKGEGGAQLIVASSDTAMEIPVALAPKVDIDLDRSAKVTDADFSLYLKKRGTMKAPAFDLNGDGRRDYIDDYIFTANYLASQKK